MEKGKGDIWMGVWRRERAMCGWESREGKGRCVDGSVEKGKDDEWMGVDRRECGCVDGSVEKRKCEM